MRKFEPRNDEEETSDLEPVSYRFYCFYSDGTLKNSVHSIHKHVHITAYNVQIYILLFVFSYCATVFLMFFNFTFTSTVVPRVFTLIKLSSYPIYIGFCKLIARKTFFLVFQFSHIVQLF